MNRHGGQGFQKKLARKITWSSEESSVHTSIGEAEDIWEREEISTSSSEEVSSAEGFDGNDMAEEDAGETQMEPIPEQHVPCGARPEGGRQTGMELSVQPESVGEHRLSPNQLGPDERTIQPVLCDRVKSQADLLLSPNEHIERIRDTTDGVSRKGKRYRRQRSNNPANDDEPKIPNKMRRKTGGQQKLLLESNVGNPRISSRSQTGLPNNDEDELECKKVVRVQPTDRRRHKWDSHNKSGKQTNHPLRDGERSGS